MEDNQRLVRVSVQADARKEYIREGKKGSFEIAVKEPARDGRANARVRKLIAAHYSVPLNEVKIVAGHHHVRKSVKVGL